MRGVVVFEGFLKVVFFCDGGGGGVDWCWLGGKDFGFEEKDEKGDDEDVGWEGFFYL